MDANKSLIVKKDNYFTRMIHFFKGLFKTKKSEENTVDEIVENDSNSNRINFLNSIREKQDNPEIVKLQRLYESDKIDTTELSYDQILELNRLYKKQISKVDEELNMKKISVNILKKKIAI